MFAESIGSKFARIKKLFADFAETTKKARKYSTTQQSKKEWDKILDEKGKAIAKLVSQLSRELVELGRIERGEKRVKL